MKIIPHPSLKIAAMLAVATMTLAACNDAIPVKQGSPEIAVSSVAPRVGAPGTRVAIDGAGFGTNTGNVRVFLGGRQLTVISVTDNAVVVEIPVGATTGEIVVQVCGRSVHDAGRFSVTAAGQVD